MLLLATTMAELQLNDPRVDELGRVNVDKRKNWESKSDKACLHGAVLGPYQQLYLRSGIAVRAWDGKGISL